MKSLSSKQKTVCIMLAIFLLFVAQLIFYINWSEQKKDFHTDEFFTYQLANSTYGPWWIIAEDKWTSPDQLTEQMVVRTPQAAFQYAEIREKQASDLHPFIYSMTINTACSVAAMFGVDFTMWTGLAVNFIFILPTSVLVYFLVKKLTQNQLTALFTAACFGFSAGVLDMVLFIRMYVMAMFWCALAALVQIHWIDKKRTITFYLSMLFISVLAVLTHYHFLLYLFFSCLVFGIYLLVQKKYKDAIFFVLTEATAGVLVIGIFPPILKQLFTPSSSTAITDDNSLFARFLIYISLLNKAIFGGLLWYILLASTILFIICKVRAKKHPYNKKSNLGWKLALMILPPVGFLAVLAVTAPYLSTRYVSMIYPVAIAGIIVVLYQAVRLLVGHRKVVCCAVSGVVLLTCTLYSYRVTAISNLNTDREPVIQLAQEHQGMKALLVGHNSWQTPYDYSELVNYSAYLWVSRESLQTSEIQEILPHEDFLIYLFSYFSGDGYVPPEEMEQILEDIYEEPISLTYQWDTRMGSVYLCSFE